MKEIYKIPKGQNIATSKGWKNIDTEIKDFIYETEQVPETFEELKELCKKYSLKIISDIIYCYGGLNFHKDGTIKDNDNSIIKINRTPQQMWNIIKNLIGEE